MLNEFQLPLINMDTYISRTLIIKSKKQKKSVWKRGRDTYPYMNICHTLAGLHLNAEHNTHWKQLSVTLLFLVLNVGKGALCDSFFVDFTVGLGSRLLF